MQPNFHLKACGAPTFDDLHSLNSLCVSIDMNKVFIGDELQTTPQWHDSVSKRHKGRNSDVDAISKEIQKMQHLSFGNISSIQFCIDGAVGLPLSSTATRVTARLMAADRSQVGEPSAPSFSNPDSDFCAPSFDLHMGWRGMFQFRR